MKFYITIFNLLLVCNLFSQGKPPTADEIRQAISGQIYSYKIPPQPVYKVENTAVWNGIDSIKVRLYYPKAGKKQRIIYNIHGGALIACDLDTHDNICRLLANKTGSIVVALDYRKPPESPYPASINDCLTVLDWIWKTASSWGGDTSNLVCVGDSGGGLLITALEVKQQGHIPIKKNVLINPAVDLRSPPKGLYALVTQMYLHGQSANDSLVSPIIATNFSFFPPTLIVTCEKDILKPHGTELYEKLQQAHVFSKLVDIHNKDHLGEYWAAAHPEAQQAIDETVNFIMASPNK